jgi:hypothetical protein
VEHEHPAEPPLAPPSPPSPVPPSLPGPMPGTSSRRRNQACWFGSVEASQIHLAVLPVGKSSTTPP